MKKIFAFLLMVCTLTFGVNAYALDASVYTLTNRVDICGQMENGEANLPVTLLMINKDADVSDISKDDIAYVMQGFTDENGRYDFRFTFDCAGKDAGNYRVMVKCANEDVSSTLLRAVSLSELFDAKTDVDYDLLNSELTAVIDNIYNAKNAECELIIAFYSESGSLIGIKTGGQTKLENQINQQSLFSDVPFGTSEVKGFLWSNIAKAYPLAKAVSDDTIDLLIIGSSVGRDSVDHLHNFAASEGVNLNVMNIYRGNGRFEQMYNSFAGGDSSAYTYYFNDDNINGRGENGIMTLKEALLYRDWDYISLQQGAWAANNFLSFNSQAEGGIKWFDEILKIVRSHRPTSEIVLHQTWSHEHGRVSPEDGKSDETTVYEEIVSTYRTAASHAATLSTDDGKMVSPSGEALMVIPNAEAFYTARHSENSSFYTTYNEATGGSNKAPTLYADGRHASINGKLLASAIWYEMLTGNDCTNSTYYQKVGVSEIIWNELADYAHLVASNHIR